MLDSSLFHVINQNIHTRLLDLTMRFITENAPLLFLLVALPFLLKNRRRGILALGLCTIGLALGDGTTNMLKHLFERPRPCQVLEDIRLLVGCGKSFSFPSGHAVNSFVAATILSWVYRRAWLVFFPLGMLVALSRVYAGVHYPSDVLAGALLGIMLGIATITSYRWVSTRFRDDPYTTAFIICMIILGLFRIYYITTGPLDLSPDEAHYWEWSRRLDLSYYSKGPMIAYIIAFTTWLMGDTVFAIRVLAPLFLALSSILVYRLSKEIYGDTRVAVASALLLQITPLFAAYGVLMTIDSPFILLWTLSVFLFWRAVSKGRQLYWVLLGISVGMGLLTKYTMAFFYVCAFLFLIFSDQYSDQYRIWLKRKEPYLAFILSLAVFSPVIIWNARHGWVTLKHTAGQAHISEGFRISFNSLLEFLGSQIGVITPLLFVSVIYGAVRAMNHASGFLFWFWAPVLGFFILKSLQGKVQANWAMPAYVTAFMASAAYFLRRPMGRGSKALLSSAVVTTMLIMILSHYTDVLRLPAKLDPSSRLKGWRELGIKVGEVYNIMISEGREVFIFSDRYQVSSELAFYIPGKPKTYCVNLGRRMNQYDIWGGLEGSSSLIGQDGIFVKIDNGKLPRRLKEAFESYSAEVFTVYRDGRVIRRYTIFRCYGFKGLKPLSIERY